MVVLYLRKVRNCLVLIGAMICVISIQINTLYSYTNPNQHDIIEISRTIRENELLLEQLQFYQNILELKKKNNKENIETYNHHIYDNILSMYKFYTVPIKTLLLAYQNTKDLAVNYAMIRSYYASLKTNISNAIEALSMIANNNIKLQNLAVEIQNINKQLKHDKKILVGYLNSQKRSSAASQQVMKTRKLLLKTDTLTTLMNQIVSNNLLPKDHKENDIFEKKYKGNLSYVTNGILVSDFRTTSSQDPRFNGISLLTQSHNNIIAPADGEIVFSDSFDNYDTLIIIKHAPSYFSIISGKYSSFVIPTQLVKKDETIALMGSKSSVIYYELEKNNKPINPGIWLSKKKH